MGSIGVPELLIVLAVVILVLGPKRIPRAAKSLGSGIKEFKAGIGKNDDDAALPQASQEPETLDGEVVRDRKA